MAKNSILKIAVIGPESTGKTSLCEALARHYDTVWVPEYARVYFNDSDIYNYNLDDLVIIAKKQMELERESLAHARRFLFCDTTLITLKIWAELEFQQTPEFIEANLKKIKYDHYFITDTQVPWIADGLRQNKHSRQLLLNMNIREVEAMGAPYTLIEGTESKRIENAIATLEGINGGRGSGQ